MHLQPASSRRRTSSVPSSSPLFPRVVAALVAVVMAAGAAQAQTDQTVTGNLTVQGPTDSTTKDTGSVIIEGGVGVEKNITAGGTVSAATLIATGGMFSSPTGVSIAAGGSNQNIVFLPTGTGKIGIGTSSPAESFHFVGSNLRFERSGKKLIIDPNDAAAGQFSEFLTDNGMGLKFGYVDVNGYAVHHLTILNNGNVGVGATSPAEKFVVNGNVHVSGNMAATGNIIALGTLDVANLTLNGTAFNPANYVQAGGGTVAGTISAHSLAATNGTVSGGNMGLTLAAGGSNQNVTITPSGTGKTVLNGDVGIGLATPTAKLDVAGGVNADAALGYRLGGALALYRHGTSYFIGDGGPGSGGSTGYGNIGIGGYTLTQNGSGSDNVAIGSEAMSANTSGMSNVAVGFSALSYNSTGAGNLAIGSMALSFNSSGSSNVAIGHLALSNVSSGSGNVGIGYLAGALVGDGNNNIAIGSEANVPSPAGSNQLSIGNLIYGSGLDGRLNTISAGNIGIGVKVPTVKLDVAGDIKSSGNITATGALSAASLTVNGTVFNPANFVQTSGGTVTGTLSAQSLSATTGSVSGGSTGLTLNAGANNQNVTINPGSGGNTILNGKVGIGTSTPLHQLTVGSVTGGTLAVSTNGVAGSQATPLEPGLKFLGYGNAVKGSIVVQDKTSNFAGGWMKFQTADSTDALQDRMMIDRGGNVGIGNVAPAEKLDVTGNIVASGNITATGVLTAATLSVGGTTLSPTNLVQTTGGYANPAWVTSLSAAKLTTGTLPAAAMPALTGDVTAAAGTTALTLANSGVAAGTYTKVTVDPKGRVITGAALSSTDVTNALAGTVTGQASGLNLTAGGSGNQNVTLTPTGAGAAIVDGPSLVLKNDNGGAGLISQILANRETYDPSGNAAAIQFHRGGNGWNGAIAFATNPGSAAGQQPTERLRISELGNVGIGTSAPATLLHLNGTAPMVTLSDTTAIAPTIGHTLVNGNPALQFGFPGAEGANRSFNFRANGNNLMTIAGSGYVGVGTQTPTQLIHVYSTDDLRTAINIQNGTTGGKEWYLQTLGVNTATRVGNFVIRNNTNAVNAIEITPSGNVGLGLDSTVPTEKLEVNGNVKVTGTITAANWSAGALTGQASGLALNAGTAGQNVTITPGSGGYTLLNGNVGIGVSVPAQALSVSGNAHVTGGVGAGVANTTAGSVVAANQFGNNGTLSSTIGYNGTYAPASVGTNVTQFSDSGVTVPSAVTTSYASFDSRPSTAAASFALASLTGFQARDNTLGANSTVTNQYGLNVLPLTLGTNIYGVRSQVASGATKYNIYADGTAQNYFAGNVGIGTSSPAFRFTNSTQTNVVDQSGVGLGGAASSFVWEHPSSIATTGYTAAILNSATNAGNHGLLVKTTNTSATNRLLTLNANGIDTFVATGAGNVGIGTTSPRELLEVGGNNTGAILVGTNTGVREVYQSESSARWQLSRDALGGGQSGLLFGGGGSISATGAALGLPANRNLAFYTSNGTTLTERMRIDLSGNVGIGKTDPTAKLDVNGSAKINGSLDVAGAVTSPSGLALNSTAGDIALTPSTGAVTIGGSSNPTVRLGSAASHLTEISANGAMRYRLNGDPASSYRWALASDANNMWNFGAAASGGLWLRSENGTGAAMVTNGTGDLVVFSSPTIPPTTPTEKMRVTGAGNVGIGTAAPSQALEVNGNILANTLTPQLRLKTNNDTTGSSEISFKNAADNTIGFIKYTYSDNSLRFRVNGTERAVIDQNGNLGIGTIAPAANTKLDVNGNAKVSGELAVGTLKIAGTAFVPDEYLRVDGVSGALSVTTLTATSGAIAGGGANGLRLTSTAGADTNIYLDPDTGGDVIIASGAKLRMNDAQQRTGEINIALPTNAGGAIETQLLDFGTQNDGGALKGYVAAGSATWKFGYRNNANLFTEGLRLNAASTGATLSVNGTVSGMNGLTLAAGGDNKDIAINASGTGRALITAGGDINLAATGASDIVLKTNGTDRLFVSDNGYVGIGTSTPAANLVVGGPRPFSVDSSAGATALQANTGGWTLNYGLVGSGGTSLGGFGANGTSNALNRFYIGTFSTDEKVSILAVSGNVGIGIPNPNAKLDVAGSGHLTGNLNVDQALAVTGNTTLSGTLSASNTTVSGTLSVTGATALTTLQVSNATILAATTVNGTFTASNGATLNGTTQAQGLEVAQSANIQGSASIQGAATIQGVSSFGNTMTFGPGSGTAGANAGGLSWGATPTASLSLLAGTGRSVVIGANGSASTGLSIATSGSVSIGLDPLSDHVALVLAAKTPAIATDANTKSLTLSGGAGLALADAGTVKLVGSGATADAGDVMIQAANVAGGDVRIGTGGVTDRMVVKNSGRVGIGTDQPSDNLSVAGSQSITGSLAVNTSGNVANALTVGSSDATAGGGGNIRLLGKTTAWEFGNDNGTLKVKAGGASSNALAVDSAGLSVAGNVTLNNGSVKGLAAPTNSTDAANVSYVQGQVPFAWDPAGNKIYLKDNESDLFGLGTIAPEYKLDVSHTKGARLAGLGLGNGLVLKRDATGSSQEWKFGIGISGGEKTLRIVDATADKDRLALTTAGRVGVGTATPQAIMHLISPDPVQGQPDEYSGAQITIQAPQNNKDHYILFKNAWMSDTDRSYGFAAVGFSEDGIGGGNVFLATKARTSGQTGTPTKHLLINHAGHVGVGVTEAYFANNTDYKFSVAGKIHAQEIVVDTLNWADYVFDENYRNAPLSEVEDHIKQHKHLPGVPSAKEVATKGVSVGEMQAVLLAKVEELTLHMIEQEKRIKKLEAENSALRASR